MLMETRMATLFFLAEADHKGLPVNEGEELTEPVRKFKSITIYSVQP